MEIDGTRPWMTMMQSSCNMMNPLVSSTTYHQSASYHTISATRSILRLEALIQLTDEESCKKAIQMGCREGLRNCFPSEACSIVWTNHEVVKQKVRISFLSTCFYFPIMVLGCHQNTQNLNSARQHTATPSCHARQMPLLTSLIAETYFNPLPHD